MRGHIRERGKGTWELRVFVGRDPISRRDRYKTKTFKGGKRQAEEALAAFLLQQGSVSVMAASFGELLDRWFSIVSRPSSPSRDPDSVQVRRA